MLSVFDMFSIGVGPSSSHTVGPMKAANEFVQQLNQQGSLSKVHRVSVELFGSLGQTGVGHGTGKAVILGLMGYAPDTIDTAIIDTVLADIHEHESLPLHGMQPIYFPRRDAIIFHRRKTKPKHSNALQFQAFTDDGLLLAEALYYSIGGGFIVHDDDFDQTSTAQLAQHQVPARYPFATAGELVNQCLDHGLSISSLMLANECVLQDKASVQAKCVDIWQVMQACIQAGIHTEGVLPGGLKVTRRAPGLYRRLKTEKNQDPMAAMDWVNLFALAVNEENAAGGRVVTAPTNGAAGIIPAVLSYYDKFIEPVSNDTAMRFLLTAAAIGILYKKNASISGAEVGCQGEVGVACSMAAAALTEILGGTVQAVENAAEIGMEHNLGLTCDPVGGLVQVPCIERNAMGAIKAINASRLALRGNGQHKVSLDKVIKTMRDTGRDMKNKYKETARGGLAVNITEC